MLTNLLICLLCAGHLMVVADTESTTQPRTPQQVKEVKETLVPAVGKTPTIQIDESSRVQLNTQKLQTVHRIAEGKFSTRQHGTNNDHPSKTEANAATPNFVTNEPNAHTHQSLRVVTQQKLIQSSNSEHQSVKQHFETSPKQQESSDVDKYTSSGRDHRTSQDKAQPTGQTPRKSHHVPTQGSANEQSPTKIQTQKRQLKSSSNPHFHPHMHMSRATKSQPNNFDLPNDVFLCNDGVFRIFSTSKCNGQIDCPDGSDELPSLCQVISSPPPKINKCTGNEFKCPTGKCISRNKIRLFDRECWHFHGNRGSEHTKRHCSSPKMLCDMNTTCISEEKRCNGVWDCLDQSDERHSPWTEPYTGPSFRCSNGYCASQGSLCDGINDCGDWSDELLCDSNGNQQRTQAPCFGYSCPSGLCLQNHQVCNGQSDCPDGSDENDCHDDQVLFWSSKRGMIITLAVLGGTLAVTVIAIVCVIVSARRKTKMLSDKKKRLETQPPSYYQKAIIPALVQGGKQTATDVAVLPVQTSTTLNEVGNTTSSP